MQSEIMHKASRVSVRAMPALFGFAQEIISEAQRQAERKESAGQTRHSTPRLKRQFLTNKVCKQNH
jgi:hypothetical protein